MKKYIQVIPEIVIFYSFSILFSSKSENIIMVEQVSHINFIFVEFFIYILLCLSLFLRLSKKADGRWQLFFVYGAITGQYFVWLFCDQCTSFGNFFYIWIKACWFWALLMGVLAVLLAKALRWCLPATAK